MSFRFGKQTVTLENYRQVFGVCSPDVLDEIRSAVLDDTQISNFIKPCGSDSYKLGQLRMAVREFIPTEYLNTFLTGKTIYVIRQGFAKNRDMSALLRYITPRGLLLDANLIEKLAEFCYIGIDISMMDFTIVPNNLVDIACKGLSHGYPMWLIVEDGCSLTEDYIQVLMRGLSLGVDVHPFLDGSWSKEALIVLFSYSNSVDLNYILSQVNSKFSAESMNVLLELAKDNVPITRLCVKDTDGYPVYNNYQMYALGEALKAGVDTPKMFDPTMSDYDIMEMVEGFRAIKESKITSGGSSKPKLESLF